MLIINRSFCFCGLEKKGEDYICLQCFFQALTKKHRMHLYYYDYITKAGYVEDNDRNKFNILYINHEDVIVYKDDLDIYDLSGELINAELIIKTDDKKKEELLNLYELYMKNKRPNNRYNNITL